MISRNKWMFGAHHDGMWIGEEYDSRDDAIKAGREEFKSGLDEYGREMKCFYVGEVMDPGFASCDFGCLVEDALEEEHYELGGEFFDGFSFERGHLDELNECVRDVVEEWAKKHNYTPGYFLIRNTESVELRGEERNE